MDELIRVADVTKVYEPLPRWMRLLTRSSTRTPVTALAGVSFTVPTGQIVAIVGPNGAGKSTLFRVLTGLTTSTSGTATVAGFEVGGHGPSLRRVVGFMPADDRALHLRLTCRENLAFHGRLHGIVGRELDTRSADVLDQVGLGHKAEAVAFGLSSGMRARLLLARALLHRPKLLILDEPTGEADPVAAYELLEVVKRAAADHGTGVLISSHRLEEIEALGERVLLMHEGTIAYDGDLPSLRRTWDRPVILIEFASATVAKSAARALAATEGVQTDPPDGRVLSVRTDRGAGAVLAALNGHIAKIKTVSETHVPLRDVLAQMARGGKAAR